MLYLSLFLCSKFAIAIAVLSGKVASYQHNHIPDSTEDLEGKQLDSSNSKRTDIKQLLTRKQAAAPPSCFLIFAAIPVAVSIWICSTRYVEFYHHGIDIKLHQLAPAKCREDQSEIYFAILF